ncbi:hypothetical protein [Paraburkholderia youngii]|uniref:hypothetical protein n=1 Tax=Paraburkholderia youngii TaxID=2782701 RepID=UPI003D226DEC
MNLQQQRDSEPQATVGAFQVIRAGDRHRFELQQPYVLQQIVPSAAAIPGTDMGDQQGGAYYLQRSGHWSGDWRQVTAARYSREIAEVYQRQIAEHDTVNVEIVDANAMEARLQVMRAVGREMEETLPRATFIDLCKRIDALPEELFANAAHTLAKTGMLECPTILAVTGLGQQERAAAHA